MGASSQPKSGTAQTLGLGPACGHQPTMPRHVAGHVFARTVPCFPGRDMRLPGLVGSPSAFPGLPLLRKPFPARPGDGATRHDLMAKVGGALDPTGGVGSTEQEMVAFPTKKEQMEAGGSHFFLCSPTFSPQPCRHAAGQQVGVSGLAPTSCLRRQVGLAGAVPDMHPPCSEGVNRSGSRQGSRERAGLGLCPTTTPLGWGVGSAQAGLGWRGLTWQRGPCRQQSPCGKLGLTRSQGCCLCLSLPLVLRWTCSLGAGRCGYAAPKVLPDPFMASC